MEKPLVHKKYKLEKFTGKGGWTYIRIPEILPAKKTPFGWVKVKGSIGGYEIRKYNLAPMGNGGLFLPVKAAIRKALKKQEGDWVEIILFADNDPLEIPFEFLACLRDEPDAFRHFYQFTEAEQKRYIDWIYDSKKINTRIERMAKAINRIRSGEKPA
jgi:uncharacterized protein YdeI (YjbR/CyaY-like superfamily)